jgi:hypothetical protein
MIDTYLVPEKTTVSGKGDGPTLDVSAATNRVFLLTLNIREVIEQESLDVSIYASVDGSAWTPKSITSFPQKFYRGQHPLLLDLSAQPTVKFLRAHWEVNRWGRGNPDPMFQFDVHIKDVPPDVLKEAAEEAQSLV